MYLHRHDDNEALAVWLFDKSSGAEWDEHFAHLRNVATWSPRLGKRGATMLIAGNFERPDAKHRAELTRLTEAPGYDPYVAFVTPNVALRAVLTMFGWVQKAPKYEMTFVGNTGDALNWLELKRGGRLEKLRTMVGEVLAEHRAAGGNVK